jgi:hypothetical protein
MPFSRYRPILPETATRASSIPTPMKPFSDIPPTDPPDFVPDDESDVPLATPEGDGDEPPDRPLDPSTIPPLERPRGNEPHYDLPFRKALD